ncbi:hypothetical protein CBR_g29966 [Chara braunii]|uniref:Uncharacterized protein n=1 Tax=Chara braunii TaxID=69332 RepID=A0A388LBZ0_CHABU|nr:hypothetical protein CBR_g29966 [Chara braunii]|eukprot:GBG79702.1 hypothetical protein CBR_g29966 [Chara braunii]
MFARGTGRGKKREGLPDDSQVTRKGRRHVPKAKRLRSDDASTRVPLGGAQGWAAEAGGDYDDDFATDKDQAHATASGVRETGGQRQSDHNASKRLMTTPPETKQVRTRDRRTDDADVDNVGDDDDEPLERRRLRSRTTATPPPAASGHTLAGETTVTGRLPTTTAAPRPRNTAAEGGSVQRGGGGVVAAHAGAVGVEAAGAAGAVAGVSGSAPPVAAAREEGAIVAMARDDAHGEKRSDREGGEAGSNRPRRGVLTNDLVDRAVLWVDDKPFWTTGEGRRLYNIVHETREYFVAIARGLPPPAIPRSVVMPKSSTRIARIADPSQLQQATSCASAVENIALRVLHGWVFKSRNRPRGYNLAFQYALESVAADIARAMWYGEEWCNVVSPAVCAHTIDLSMDLPLWFAGMNVENRPDDDDMAAYQESTIICVAHAFLAVVQMGAVIDGEFISHDRLCRVADCFRLLLAACMWIMRMAGDDPRSHFEAFYFATLVSRPTLVASMHRSFNHRRSVGLAVKAVTERLGKANATFGEHPDYLPRWVDRGIVFRHGARIDGPEGAKKLDWLGSGPADDDNDDDDKGDA